MNLMTVDGHHGTIEFNSDLDLFAGDIRVATHPGLIGSPTLEFGMRT